MGNFRRIIPELIGTEQHPHGNHRPLLAAALSLKRLLRRMYFRTCFRERCRVWSMIARSVAPPSAAHFARPKRKKWPGLRRRQRA